MMYYSVFNQPAHLSLPITVECESFEDICAGLVNPETYPNKTLCPGIKLAVFNGKRNHENLEGFSGVELDYDDGKMRPEEVSVILSHHGIKHFIYTTPTHQPFLPRFRVLVPFSDYWDMDVREDAMRKLTHLLNDSFAPESRTASQFFYYGQIEGVLYETFYGAGEFIDELEFDIPEPVVVPKTLTPKSVDRDKPAPVHTIKEVLDKYFKADDYDTWQKVGQRLKGLGDEGYKLWVEWSRTSPEHNERSCELKWNQLKGERTGYESLFEIATKKYGWVNKGDHPADILARTNWEAGVDSQPKPSTLSDLAINNNTDALKLRVMNEVYAIDKIALTGQITILYAEPNCGKTLLTLYSLIESVKAGRIKGEDVFYINADDDFNAMITKAEILKQYGIQCITPGENGFETEDLVPILKEMIKSDELSGKIIVLDTLTQFTNLMDKNNNRDFMKSMKKCTDKQATIIALAHTNKARGPDGKLIPEGTADMRNGCHAMYVLDLSESEDGKHSVVSFIRKKKRGGNANLVKFKYDNFEKAIEYQTLLDTVMELSDTTPVKSRAKIEEYSSFDVDVVLDYIKAHPGGITLKELNIYGAGNGMKHIKQIVEDNMHRLKRVGDVFKLE